MRSVVLLSGGLDSSTLLAKVLKELPEEADPAEVLGLTLNYGSTHNEREYQAAIEIAKHYGITHERRTLPDIFKGAGSALMDEGAEVPDAEYNQLGPQPTVVPFRNANLISVATTLAVTHEAFDVYIAAHASDHEAWAYPDCSPEFLGAMACAIWTGTMGAVRLRFPFVWMTKGDIVTEAAALNVPIYQTYSCYRGGLHHCGNCPTCRERHEAFVQAGFLDPTLYERNFPEQKGARLWPLKVV